LAGLSPGDLLSIQQQFATKAPEIATPAAALNTPRYLQDTLAEQTNTALAGLQPTDLGQLVTQLSTLHTQFTGNVADAQALGINNPTTQNQISQALTAQVASVLQNLDINQLKEVIDAIGNTAPEIAAMADALIKAGDAAGQFAQQAKQLYQDLTGGSLSGLAPGAQVAVAQAKVSAEQAHVQGGNTAMLGQFITDATNLVNLAQQTFGNAPLTAQIRTQVTNALAPFVPGGTTFTLQQEQTLAESANPPSTLPTPSQAAASATSGATGAFSSVIPAQPSAAAVNSATAAAVAAATTAATLSVANQ
jgi:hypothetical protein